MASVQLTAHAIKDLDRLIAVLELPADTRKRVEKSLRTLSEFPLSGSELEGAWKRYRRWAGPWPWMILVYEYSIETDTVSILTVHDTRSSVAATNARGS